MVPKTSMEICTDQSGALAGYCTDCSINNDVRAGPMTSLTSALYGYELSTLAAGGGILSLQGMEFQQ